MKIVRINPLDKDAGNKVAAFFDVKTDDGIVIKGFRIVNGTNGLFISSPDAKGKDGKYYERVTMPAEMKNDLQKMAIEQYSSQS